MSAFDAVALVVGLAACGTDITRRRVPNLLTGSAVVCGLAAHALLPSGHGLAGALLGFAAGLLVFFPFFALGGMGGGDVKLMAASGLWFNLHGGLLMILWTVLAGGVLALLILLLRLFGWPDWVRARVAVLRRGSGIPYGVAIAAGTLITVSLN